MKKDNKVFWCKNCLNMSTRPRIQFDEKGWCNACIWMEKKKTVNWEKRQIEFKNIIKNYKSDGNYNCILPVSGGKDSCYVTYKIKEEYGLNPLAITSRPPLESEVGKKNLHNYVQAGYCDHMHVTANNKAMKKLNKLGFEEKGSPYWGWLVSIFSVIIRVAIEKKINLIIYGEDGELEYGGTTHNLDSFVFSREYITDVFCEGDYKRLIEKSRLTKEEKYWFEIPDLEKLNFKLGMTHMSYFEPWDSYKNYILAKEKFNLQENEDGNKGTFTNFAQNDQALYSLHTYLMYLKFGFGRATQDAGIEIRRGAMNRSQAINLVKLYDNHFPKEHLKLYLDYYEMKEKAFLEVIDKWANKELFEKKSEYWFPKFQIK